MKRWQVVSITASWMALASVVATGVEQGRQGPGQSQQQQTPVDQRQKVKSTSVTGVILKVALGPKGEFIQVRPDAGGKQQPQQQAAAAVQRPAPLVLILGADTRITRDNNLVSRRALETGQRVKATHVAKPIVYNPTEESPDPKLGKNYRALSIAILE